MPDNTLLNPGTGGDNVRSVDRSGAGPKTQVTALDVGASGAGNERILTVGQQTAALSLPVVLASNQSSVNTVEQATVLTGQAAQTAVVNNILEAAAGATPTDVRNLRAASVQVVSTGTGGTFIFEQSNDNVNWVPLPVFNAALTTGVAIVAAITATASQIVYTFSLRCVFIRLRIVTAITGGSIQAFSRFSSEPWTPAAQLVSNPTGANLAVSGTVTANIGTGSIAAGTNAIGDVGLQVRANATGAASVTNVVAAATANPTVIKASAGRVLGYQFTNNATAVRYVKLHNTSAAPTAGTGVVMTIGIPPNGGIATLTIPAGIAFTTGIGLTTVTGAAAADATAVAANDVVGHIVWA